MLVLTRKTQQQIQIGDKITITILRVKGNSVRVGIDAPRVERIIRSELNDQPAGDHQESAQPKSETADSQPVAEHLIVEDIVCDDCDVVADDQAVRPLANRVRMLTQAVRYPQPLTARSLRLTRSGFSG